MRLPAIVLLSMIVGGSCAERGITDKIDLAVDYDAIPTMTTTDVITLISDSGYTRYRITADLWLVYDEATTPMWRFPEGLLLEKFDKAYATEATVICDSATYFKKDQLWRLDGNVNIVNAIGEKFLTPQLFWSQREGKIYSDSFIHIERTDRTIEGYGFESNDRMTRYSVNNPTGIFPANDFKPGAHTATAENPTDSTSTESATSTPAPKPGNSSPSTPPQSVAQKPNKTLKSKPIEPNQQKPPTLK